ncbi:30S ribosomal protein S2 [Candidatus Woesearchaeota archaeon]|nr:30S ribosomal protein S2 [Candidatus Woesearchaeota archaeon]
MAEEELMTPLENYLKTGIHIGTKFKTKYMEPFIYKVRQDGLTVLNVQEIDKRLRVVAKMLSRYEPNDILIVCRRENGWSVVKMFSELTGIKVFAGRYPPGILTNNSLESFTETKLIMVVDPWPDRNVINDAINIGIPVIALCDTNNASNNIDLVMPCNNKGKKSLGLIFWVLAREYLKERKKEISKPLDDFIVE